jgi:hypothetical protein
MNNRFSRTRGDCIVGFWASAPAVVIPLLFLTWWHRMTSFPSDPASFDEFDSSFHSMADHLAFGMFGAGALCLWAAIAAVGMPLVGLLWWSYVPRLFGREYVPRTCLSPS